MRTLSHLGCGLLFALVFPTIAGAAVPTEMNVQGRLTASGGGPAPVGFKQFTFRIFGQETGGLAIWPAGSGEVQSIATDANGLWSGAVGALIPLTEAVFDSPVRWLEVSVDDGVNPPETLPRVQLRTNPYAYHSATSMIADSLASAAISGLSDIFVDESGDSITGALSIERHVKDSGTTVEADNLNDGWAGKWPDQQGTWGITADVAGNGSALNVGVAGSAQGDNNGLDANYGLLGYADGAGSVNIGIQASTGQQGTVNYSGYFYHGDFLVDSPQTPGTGGVLLPPDAISSPEILDEPGLVSSSNPNETILNSSAMSDLITVTITIPTSGYIKLDGMGNIIYSGTIGTCYAWYQIDETPGGGVAAGYYSGGGEAALGSTLGNQYSLYVQRIFFKPAGTYTFRLEGQAYSFNAGGAIASCRNSMLTACFFPSSYGTVMAAMSAEEAADMETVKTVKAPNGGTIPESAGGTIHMVDLRELELRAARAEADAERARREVLEARLKVLESGDGEIHR